MEPMDSTQAPGREITIRDAVAADAPVLARVDPLAAAGDHDRRAAIERWVTAAGTRVAQDQSELIGYCVTERTFFDQAFVTMLMVASDARGRGTGARLLLDAQRRRSTARLFTSANLSNQPMQRLLSRLGWQSAGIVYGLDEGDPELIFLAPSVAVGS
jgi:ribosomal protein S18 acetylase RimI-like enzyme